MALTLNNSTLIIHVTSSSHYVHTYIARYVGTLKIKRTLVLVGNLRLRVCYYPRGLATVYSKIFKGENFHGFCGFLTLP